MILQQALMFEEAVCEEIFTEYVRQREDAIYTQSRKRMRVQHAMDCIVNKACAMVGRGYTQAGIPKRPSDIRPFNRILKLNLLNNPVKLDNSIYFNANEFHHLLVPFTAGMQAIQFEQALMVLCF